MTVNPTVFEKAIAGKTDYNDARQKLVADGKSVNEIYAALAIEGVHDGPELVFTLLRNRCSRWTEIRKQRSDTRSPYFFLSERGPMTRQAINYLAGQIGQRAKLRFHVHPHMLRHSTGYYLANRGYDTRLVQDYLGAQEHRSYGEIYQNGSITL